MARCKLTRMSLRNIRKDKQYQCIVIDFVRTGVISKSKAEELLNYTIPAGLLEGSVAAPDDDDEDEPGTGTGETDNTVTLLYLDTPPSGDVWVTEEYTLQENTTTQDIINAAKSLFGDDTLNIGSVVTENPEYVEGETAPVLKYAAVDPQPEAIEPGMLIWCSYLNISGGGLEGGGGLTPGGSDINSPIEP